MTHLPLNCNHINFLLIQLFYQITIQSVGRYLYIITIMLIYVHVGKEVHFLYEYNTISFIHPII